MNDPITFEWRLKTGIKELLNTIKALPQIGMAQPILNIFVPKIEDYIVKNPEEARKIIIKVRDRLNYILGDDK